jgi:hypothetical protein
VPGDVVEMTPEQAETKLASGRLVLAKEKKAETMAGTVDQEAIIEAIGKLDPAVDDNWMNDGRPQVKAIENVLGKGIKAGDRDAAWDAMPEDSKPKRPE